jgi:hypothetical protein
MRSIHRFVCLSNPAYAWNDHTKLMFPTVSLNFHDIALAANNFGTERGIAYLLGSWGC